MSPGVVRQLLANISISISLLVVGSTLGWPSPVILAIQETGKPFNMTHDEIAIMVSNLYTGNILSPIPSGILMDALGRKNTLHYMTVIPIATWLLVYLAKAPIYLHFSRFLAGVWLGAAGTIVPIYVAEVSEPSVRGAFSTFFQLMTHLGVLFVFLIGSWMDYYNLTFVLGAIPVALAVAMTFIPESPYWYVKQGRHEDAIRSLGWLRCRAPGQIKEELGRIEESVTEEMRRGTSFRDLFRTKGNRKAFLIAQVYSVTQRASGISALMAYASVTLPSGVGPLSPNDCVTVMGTLLVVSVFLSTFLVDMLGRRQLLTFSSLGSGLAMLTAGIWFFLDSKTYVDVRSVSWIPFASFLAYSALFSVGLGPLTTTVQGELFPANVKGLASGIASVVTAATSFATNILYQRIADAWGMYLNYWLFAVAGLAAALFTVCCLVETKGKTLQQIQRELNKKG